MALILEDIKGLIAIAQSEEDGMAARTDILIEIQEEYMERHLHRYIHKNTVGGMDADDMRQIFLIACSAAIDKVDPNKGNPLLFVIQCGKWAVVNKLREGYRRHIRQYCHSCKTETRIYEKDHAVQCPKCGEIDEGVVERFQRDISDDGAVFAFARDESMDLAEEAISRMMVDEFRARLDGRKADVFDLIVRQGYDRESCVNYIRSVADQLGVTPANVNRRLCQLKEEWAQYIGA